MRQAIISIILILGWVSMAPASALEKRIKNISRAEMQGVVEFLSHDLVEGRGPGTRGGDLAEIYMRSIFKFLDLEPGHKGSYLQPFTLKGFTLDKLTVDTDDMKLILPDDIIGSYVREDNQFDFQADTVFVGFGIHAPLWNWDDFKNVDVKNKILICRVNDPGFFLGDIFEGKTLTYFGRWKYHMEEAARRGAIGILLIHTDETAGYGWSVVENSWSGEEVYLESDLKNKLKFRAWIKESSLRKILEARNIDLEGLYRRSLGRDFTPVDLGFAIRVRGTNRFRELSNRNVIAHLPGKVPERIVISAHIDHFGIDDKKEGDNIYNGAIDNGSAVASMAVAAKILKEFEDDLYYSVTFLACNSEEAGMLGSLYYVQNTNRENIVANINFESTPVWEKADSIMGIGARFSTFEEMLESLAKKAGLRYRQFSMSNQGFFYRSDQYSFARHDIPAVWISAGEDDASGEKKYPRFWETTYHTVDDEYDPEWKLEGMRQTIRFALLLIHHLNQGKTVPRWKKNLTFPMESVRKNPPGSQPVTDG